jgi:hypothetical protein
MGHDVSPANNATLDEAERALAWCAGNPLSPPLRLAPQGLDAIRAGTFGISMPPAFPGQARESAPGRFVFTTPPGTPDTLVTSALPLYAAQTHSPLQTHTPHTIYFEVRIGRAPARDVGLAIGFLAPPYPPFRLPGWERASLGVHGDDGHRYVNDRWGGKDFTAPFAPGQTVGLGMSFSRGVAGEALPTYDEVGRRVGVRVFFTRDGRLDGEWDLLEQTDAGQDLPVDGLEGSRDLYAGVGMFEATDFEIVLDRSSWLYRP